MFACIKIYTQTGMPRAGHASCNVARLVLGEMQPRGPCDRWLQQDSFAAGEAAGSVRTGNPLPPCGAARRAYDDQIIHAKSIG